MNMRQLLAVAILGASLGLETSAAFAEGNADPRLFEPASPETTVSTTDTTQGVVAGTDAPQQVFVSSDQSHDSQGR